MRKVSAGSSQESVSTDFQARNTYGWPKTGKAVGALSWVLKYKAEEVAFTGKTFLQIITKQWSEGAAFLCRSTQN